MPSNIEYAFMALDYVRSRIPPNRADNKPWGHESAQQWFNRQMVGDKVRQLRTHPTNVQNAPSTLENITTYGKRALVAHTGNCLEVSCGVANYLATQCGFYYFDLVHFEDRDHTFIAIGQPARARYPDDFGTWEADAAICDVWADIACPARDFPARWRARMNNWHIMDLKPAGRDATSDYWYNAVDSGKLSHGG